MKPGTTSDHGPRSAFSLVEVLIVILVISLLASLLFGVVFNLRKKADILATSKRMQDIMTQLGAQGLNKGGPAFHYARLFGLSLAAGSAKTTANEMRDALLALGPDAPRNVEYDDYVDDVMAQFAGWGGDAEIWGSIPWGVGPDSDHGVNPSLDRDPGAYVSNNPWGRPKLLLDDGTRNDPDPVTGLSQMEQINIRQLNPLLSFFFLWKAGILPPDDVSTAAVFEPLRSYLSDRSATKPWNDRWGNPIVVSYLLFEPRDRAWNRVVDTDTLGDVDDPQFSQQELWTRALKSFGFNRMLYMTAGAAGPVLRNGRSTEAVLVPRVWDHILHVVSEDDPTDVLWNELHFASPPWKDIRHEEVGNYMGFLGEPFELR